MIRSLVTGGSGFIGHYLVSALLARGRAVRILDLHPPSQAGVEYLPGSVLDRALVEEAFSGVEEVYHLAGLPGMWMPQVDDFHAVNCRGTEVVVAAARKHGVARLLHCSTESILFGRSMSDVVVTEQCTATLDEMSGPYTRSKLGAEQIALQAAASGDPVVIAIPTMPLGPHDRNLTPPTAMLLHFLRRRIQIYLDFMMNLVDVRDAAAGLILVMERGQIGHRYIIGGENLRLGELLKLAGQISGRNAVRIAIPGAVAKLTATAMEFGADHITHRPPAATLEGIRIALRSKELSIEKARCELGYAPRSIELVLRETISFLLGG